MLVDQSYRRLPAFPGHRLNSWARVVAHEVGEHQDRIDPVHLAEKVEMGDPVGVLVEAPRPMDNRCGSVGVSLITDSPIPLPSSLSPIYLGTWPLFRRR